jgi:hypothetical protein
VKTPESEEDQPLAKQPQGKVKGVLVGVGLDGEDGHVRVTTGDNYKLVGGSPDTHECMQEKAIKFNEELRKRGKRIEEASKLELRDIAEKVGLKERE